MYSFENPSKMKKCDMTFANSLSRGVILHGKSYNYCIEHVLGEGSFGITYLASVKMQGSLGCIDANLKVAIKEFFMKEINGRENSIVTSGNQSGLFENYRRKFICEARNLSKLKHPNIIKVLECFEENNTVYYAMEYLDGGSLDELINKKHGLPTIDAIRYASLISNALSYMHKRKVLHLDLKPGNIMLHDDNPVLIDFGLSKQYDENGCPESSTTIGGGTPGYAPIEQASYHDGKDFPVTMDVYALGATLFKMLTGERPPEASYIINEGFPSWELYGKVVSKALCDCVEKAMSARTRERFCSIDAFAKCLSEIYVSICGDKKDNTCKRERSNANVQNNEQTIFDGTQREDKHRKETYNNINIFVYTKERYLYCCNSNLWQSFELMNPLSYENYYNIYPPKEAVKGYTIEDFIRNLLDELN